MNNHAGGANDDGHIIPTSSMISVIKINKKKREDILDDEGLHLKPLYALLDNTVIITIEDPKKKPTSQKKDQKRETLEAGPSASTAAGTHLASHNWSSIIVITMVCASRALE